MQAFPFNNQYLTLGETFFRKTRPSPVSNPALIRFNDALADEMGLPMQDFNADDIAAVFSGNVVPDGAEPLAMAYSGHQFGHFSPQLGDGRAILLGEISGAGGASMGLQLKGSGRTHYSRNGDGRAALGPVLREYLVSEAMYRLGVPTTRALAAVTTGEEVARERLVPGGIITRVASSFVRVGTFEYFASRGDVQSIQMLADHVIAQNYPQALEEEDPYAALLQAVTDGQASLIARWMQLGFIHGVMNTDNMSVAGETIDYGPCAFMDAYDHDQVFSSIDHQGRYAYSNQPAIGLWNLTRLAECLVPLIDENIDAAVECAQDILQSYRSSHEDDWLSGMCAKCGLSHVSDEVKSQDKALIEDLLDMMAANHADYTLTFFNLSQLSAQPSDKDRVCTDLFGDQAQFDQWLSRWRERLARETCSDEQRQANMQSINPVYIPRNHQIEAAIRAAEDHDDFSVFHELHEVLESPYVQQAGKDRYMQPPEPDEVVECTFCGT
ncbi:MAG: YdiU family protein [Gammaproteobacteria bacterium]|nr:YdiU family protein [Gammaproteobacteria bacterium]